MTAMEKVIPATSNAGVAALERLNRERSDYIRANNQLTTRARVAVRRRLLEVVGTAPDRDAKASAIRARANAIVKAYMTDAKLANQDKAIVQEVPQLQTFRGMLQTGKSARSATEREIEKMAGGVLEDQRTVRRILRSLPRKH